MLTDLQIENILLIDKTNIHFHSGFSVITGAGRNKGIGAEICRMLASQGVNICFTSYDLYDCTVARIDLSDFEKTKHQCESLGVKAVFKSIDLRELSKIKELFDFAEDKLGKIKILVNCLCYHKEDGITSLNEVDIDNSLQVNSKAVLLLCYEFYNRSSLGGRIVNISSTQDIETLTNEIAYAISKASVPVITKTLAPIVAKRDITINAVNPGPTDIGINVECNEIYKANNVFNRIGTPQDVANIVKFLVSEDAKWITGQVINSEGALQRELFPL